MDIKYVEVPVRVKPNTQYLDMKGLDALWEQIKEYVRTHGGEGGSGTVGAVNEEEVNAIIAKFYEDHRDELKGEPFTYADFTASQLAALKGEPGKDGKDGKDGYTPLKGIDYFDGKDGKDGVDGTVVFEELTEEQLDLIRGEKGDQGEPFKYEDFTPEQLEALRGPKGADGTMVFEDLTDEQREMLRGPQGIQGEQGMQGERGDTGAALTFDMLTADQIELLRGPAGESITWDSLTDEQKAELKGEQGERGVQGIPGRQGDKGDPGEVDYSLVYTKAQVDELLKNVDLDPDDINLENYYIKDELYNRGEIDALIASLVIEGAAGVHIGPDAPTIAGVSVWVDTNGVSYNGDVDLSEVYYDKDYIDNVIETHTHRLSEMEMDIDIATGLDIPTKVSDLADDVGILTVERVYEKSEVYNKTEVDTTLTGYYKKTDVLPENHTHANKGILDNLTESDGKLLYNGVQLGASGSPIDLSEYAKQSDVNTQLSNAMALKADLTHGHADYLRFAIVTEAPAEQEQGVLYIVTN